MIGPTEQQRRGAGLAAFVLGVAALLALACGGGGGGGPGPGEGQGEGPGRRYQPLALSPREEEALGQKAFRQVEEEYRGRITDSGPQVQRIENVAGRIVRAAHIEPLEREINLQVKWKYYDWRYALVDKPEVNAFCLPGGKIVVFTGLFRVVGNNDAFLATVLSHEIAHALAHHTSERLAREQGSGKSLGALRFERWQESEADHIGVFLMAFAGYDPEEAVRFWERMAQATGGGHLPEILSDHPSDEHRIQKMGGWAGAAAAAKRAYDRGRVAPARGG